MSVDAKVSKYLSKLDKATDESKKQIYRQKLDYYKSQCADELQKPVAYHLKNYKLNTNSNPIKAIAYGTDHKDHPLFLMDFDRRHPMPDDVVIQILYCGVCHSDWHIILDEWKNTKYPLIPGHEITGKVIKIGDAVTKFKVGDSVAVGPNYNSCMVCKQCKKGFEQYCENDTTEVYNMPDRKPDEIKTNKKPTGPITYGGYSNTITVNEHFVLMIPPGAPLDKLAPLLCAGATMYTPLKHFGAKEGMRIGIAGIGGLGHMGIRLNKNFFGAEMIALTRTPAKLSDSIRLGAHKALLMTDTDSLKPFENTFDLIIDTIPFKHDLGPYIKLLKTNSDAILWIIGSFFDMNIDFNEINRHKRVVKGSIIAGLFESQNIINMCIQNNIYPEIELIDIKDINKTHRKLIKSEVRYRYVIDMSSLKP